jgi:hypothetical protein
MMRQMRRIRFEVDQDQRRLFRPAEQECPAISPQPRALLGKGPPCYTSYLTAPLFRRDAAAFRRWLGE